MGFRRAARTDGNQKQITRELRALGFRVDITSQLKKLYDLVVTGKINGAVRTVRVELKIPGESLTPDEAEYHRAEPYPETLLIAESTEDILEWFSTKSDFVKVEDTSVSVDVNKLDTTLIIPSSIISKLKERRSTRNSTTKEI